MDADTIKDFVIYFTAIVWEAMPYIVLGALIAGILEEFLPHEAINKFLPKNVFLAVLIGAGLGLVFPMCECGIVVVMRRLMKKGLPLACCVSYMLAGPIVNPVVLLSTYVAFYKHSGVIVADDGLIEFSLGWPMVFYRAGLGFLVAYLTGLIVYLVEKKSRTSLTHPSVLPDAGSSRLELPVERVAEPAKRRTLLQRLANISNTALHDFIDIMVFLIIGSVLAALIRMHPNFSNLEPFTRQSPLLAIPLMMGVAILLCLCSEADAFLAASFKAMSFSAKLAFLVMGPMVDLKLLLMWTRVFRTRVIITILLSTFLSIWCYSTIIHLIFNPTAVGVSPLAK